MSWSWPERAPARGGDRHGRRHARSATTSPPPGTASWPGGRASRRSTRSTRRGSTCRIAAEVKDFDPSDVLDRKEIRRTDRYIQFALVAARQAMDDAGLPARLDGDDRGAHRRDHRLGAGRRAHAVRQRAGDGASAGPDRISPFFIPMGIANVGAGQVAIASGAIGPNFATVSACATGGHAIGEAWETIRRGDADMMIAGGVEAGIHEATIGGFASMKALSTRNDDPAARLAAVRPGPRRLRDRRGRRRRSSSRRSSTPRRAAPTPLAELVGYGATADASHITLPAPGGIGAVARPRGGRSRRRAGARRDRPRQRPRDVHAGGRQGRAGRRSARSSATTRRTWR